MAINLQSEADKALRALNQGHPASAYKTARAVLRKAPAQPFFHNLAGLALCAQNRHRDAVTHFRKAMRADPAFVDAQKNLAQTLVLLNEDATARSLLTRLREQHPDDADIAYLQGLSLSKGDDQAAAESALDQAVSLAPKLAKSYNLRGIVRRNRARLGPAIADFRAALDLAPGAVEVMSNLAYAQALNADSESALETLEAALRLAPDSVNILHRYAGLNTDMGRTDAAAKAYRRILELDNTHAAALANLAMLEPGDNADMAPRFSALHDGLHRQDPGRVDLAFALWNVLRRAGRHDEAEVWLKRANAQAAALRPYDAALCADILARSRRQFPPGAPVPRNQADSGPRPIFVLGLIRSGTSLTEQILASAPGVFGAGESALAARLAREIASGDAPFDAHAARAFAEGYRADMPPLPEGTRAFVDKMPDNFQRIGFLRAAFPEARIISLCRDPRDTALSAYSNNLPDPGLAFSNDLEAMAEYFNFYKRMMQHWEALFPGEILNWHYEEMVQDIDAASRRLAEFCGLDWHPDMARPESNTRVVRTASALQVRQPVHSRSVGGWRRHEQLLAPFIARLDPALWPEIAAD